MMTYTAAIGSAVAAVAPPTVHSAPPTVHSILTTVSLDISNIYNLSCAIAFRDAANKHTAHAAAGFTDAGLGLGTPTRAALPTDLYVWGSTTKMFTAAAIMQLVDQKIVSLDDGIERHIDPFLQKLNGTKLADHFGSRISLVKVRHLLHMTAGIEDYDGSAYTKAQFDNRQHDFSPLEIISRFVPPLSRYAKPGERQRYCSTNYILLGLVLANHKATPPKPPAKLTWQDYDQRSVFLSPNASSSPFANITFADKGSCKSHTIVHGFLQSYEGAPWLQPQDVWNVSCLGGWTAGNLVAPVDDVAAFTLELYRPGGSLISGERQKDMTNWAVQDPRQHFAFYGMGTFNLNWTVNNKAAYGHVGDTYGYQSSATYFPDLDASIAVATDAETSSQAQPADATCRAYNMIKAALQGKSVLPKCAFKTHGHFFGSCECQ